MNFCTRCGRRAGSGIRFCTGCGAPLGAAAGPAAPRAAQAAQAPAGPAWRRVPGGRITIAVAVAVLAAAGGVAGWQLSGQHGPAAPVADSPPAQAGQPGAASPGSPAPGASPLATGSPPAATGPAAPPPASAPATASTPAPAGPGPAGQGGPVVIGAGLAGQPSATTVAAFLDRYFTAINHRNYRGYLRLFDRQGQPAPTRQQFIAGYRSTTDSRERLAGLSATAAGWAARVTFRSHQDRALSATRTACTNWRITLYLETDGNSFLIGSAPAGYHASFRAC